MARPRTALYKCSKNDRRSRSRRRIRRKRSVELSNESTDYELTKVERLADVAEPLEQMLSGKIAEGYGIDEAIELTKMMVGLYGE